MPAICYEEANFTAATTDRIDQANAILAEYTAAGYVLTLRQLYYQMVARDLLPNTEREYKNFGNAISRGRLAGLIDWDAIEDRTRTVASRPHWDGVADIIRACSREYARDLWAAQSNYCEVWIEKEALIGVIDRMCAEWDVPYSACRGYTSQSALWRAAQRLITAEADGKDAVVHYLGDHDPSGLDMGDDIRNRLRRFGSNADVVRIALTREQIDQYAPPPNPAKVTDSRFERYAAQYGAESWELDALNPDVINELIVEQIEALIDPVPWKRAIAREERGRERLAQIANKYPQVRKFLGKLDAAEED